MVIGLVCLVVSVVINAFVDPWKLLFSAFYLPLIGILLITPKRLRQRISLLSATD
jgi:hypothetical protein